MAQVNYSFCNLCDSCCGLIIEHDGQQILSIRGDKDNVLSRGHVCPKCLALMDIYNDPSRIRKPLRKRGKEWEEISWKEAIEETAERITDIQKKYGNDSLAFFFGNPVAHNYATLLTILPFINTLKTKNIYTANSVDAWPRLLVSILLYGNQALLPIPDIERTKYFLILGANPIISHGSVMTAPDCKRRFRELQERGGKIVVIDPRRSETAKIADEHYFIKHGTDHLFIFSMLHILFKEKLIKLNHLSNKIEGIKEVEVLAREFAPEKFSEQTGIETKVIYKITREFAKADSAVCYGRMGTRTQKNATVTTWLIDLLNILTGNIDSPGGAMFTTPAVDLVGMAKLLRRTDWFGRTRSRVNGFPDLTGELPVAALYDELERHGAGQIKALLTLAGNPVLSLPNSKRFEKALKNLEFMVSIDFYINETTQYSNIILPPVTYLESDHYPIIELATSIRNTAHYSDTVISPAADSKQEWEILEYLGRNIGSNRGILEKTKAILKYVILKKVGPERILDILLRFGPHKLSLQELRKYPHGLDLGGLKPRLLEEMNNKKVNLLPGLIAKEIESIKLELDDKNSGGYHLVNRRNLLGMNTYLHNFPRLLKGDNRCTLLINLSDAEKLNISNGETVRVKSRVGTIEIPVEITDEIMPGVVCIPFGWGHNSDGARLAIANKIPGVNINIIIDEKIIDTISGTSAVNGTKVSIEKIIES
jgi:anaerobic selenocysteine-containing dehydrogenase